MKGILITPENTVTVRDFGEPTLSGLQEAVGGHIETPPTQIPPYVLVINDEGKLRRLPLNRIASELYGAALHRDLIVGPAVLVKRGINEDGEPDLLGLTEQEAEDLANVIRRYGGGNSDAVH